MFENAGKQRFQDSSGSARLRIPGRARTDASSIVLPSNGVRVPGCENLQPVTEKRLKHLTAFANRGLSGYSRLKTVGRSHGFRCLAQKAPDRCLLKNIVATQNSSALPVRTTLSRVHAPIWKAKNGAGEVRHERTSACQTTSGKIFPMSGACSKT